MTSSTVTPKNLVTKQIELPAGQIPSDWLIAVVKPDGSLGQFWVGAALPALLPSVSVVGQPSSPNYKLRIVRRDQNLAPIGSAVDMPFALDQTVTVPDTFSVELA